MAQTCTRCPADRDKNPEAFYANPKYPWCKACQKASRRPETKAASIKRFQDWRLNRLREYQEKMNAYKAQTPCADCGQKFHPIVMDFDHLDPSQKSMNLSRMIRQSKPWSAIELEMAKCELVCANCHRLRTLRRSHV